MAVFYHVNDYNQAQKSLTHLSKTGAFIHNFIHILFHSVLRRKSSPESMLFVVKDRLEGLKKQHWLLENGKMYTGGKGIGMSTVQRGAIL